MTPLKKSYSHILYQFHCSYLKSLVAVLAKAQLRWGLKRKEKFALD